MAGAPILGVLPTPTPLAPAAFARKSRDAVVLDTRTSLNFTAAHVRDSLSIWLDGLSSFGGWFLPGDRPILLVNETDDSTEIVRRLIRMGYDDLAGYLSGGMIDWLAGGRASPSLGGVTAQELCQRLDAGEELWILDVRSDAELARTGQILGAHHIHITQLPDRLEEVPRDRPVYILCHSGRRATTAASLLQRAGHQDVVVILGGLAGWDSVTCPPG